MTSFHYDEAAEQSTLGALLIGGPPALKTASAIVSGRDFYRDSHREVYNVIVHLSEIEVPIDLLTVEQELRRRDVYEQYGGLSFLAGLFDSVPTPLHVAEYAQAVRLCSLWRGR